ncbi:MAG: thiamine phosphate synthase [Acidobacteriota bacterium]|nr:thiamine phosphate synthase [Acidobacteriota bacterium]MDH3786681.1 thiamine phosphate synthase [Acidobacteriota bacterium]
MASVGRLHVLTTDAYGGAIDHLEIARESLAGGADTIQYRAKADGSKLTEPRLLELIDLSRRYEATLLVNDDVGLAARYGLGVHLGAGDVNPMEARRRLGARACIGFTVHDAREARYSRELPVDYVGVGPVFGSTSKPSAGPALGLDGLARIVGEVQVPVIAIGNIRVESVRAVLAAGAYGVAVGAAVAAAANRRDATRALSDTMGVRETLP